MNCRALNAEAQKVRIEAMYTGGGGQKLQVRKADQALLSV